MILNVVDIEATCWPKDDPGQHVSDIIEIGLTPVDLALGERLGKHKILVRPERSTVSEFCAELTGLTQDAWASWGDYDPNQFRRQCADTGVGYPFGEAHVNAKSVFGTVYRGRHGMARALELAGLPLEGRHHDGADDSWNIAALILHLRAAGHWPLTATAA